MTKSSVKNAPFLHSGEIAINLHLDLLIGLLSVMIIGVVLNGFRVLAVSVISCLSSLIAETLGAMLIKRHLENDLRSIAMGLIIALICPISVPIWLPAVSSAVSVLFVRVILGPNYKNLFMTPVIGWLLMLSFAPVSMTSYPAMRGFGIFPIFGEVGSFISAPSVAQLLQTNNRPTYTFLQLLTGDYPGGMGTTCIFVILAVCVYFVFRKSMAWQVSLSMIITVAVFALIFNRSGTSLIFSVLYELTATSYIFVAVFVAGDIISAPMQTFAKIVYGILIGVLTMLFRYFGLTDHSVVLSLIIAHLLAGFLDIIALKLQIYRLKNK